MEVHLGEATAEMEVEGFDLEDYHDLINALKDGPEVAATASFEVEWSGVLERIELRDPTNQFRGRYIRDTAEVSFTAENAAGFVFRTDPDAPQTNLFSIIGRERNGAFFT